MGNVHRRGNDDSDGRRMKRKPEGSMTFESGMLGNLGDDRGCREGGGPDGPRVIYGECKIKDGERGAGCGVREGYGPLRGPIL